MAKLLNLSSVATITLALSGCATMFSQTNYPVQIDSSPAHIPFKVFKQTEAGNILITEGTTPKVVVLSAGGDHYFARNSYRVQFTYKKKNYESLLKPTIDGWYFLNFFIGGVGFLIIDPMTGAMYKLPAIYRYDISSQLSSSSVQVKTINELTVAERARLIPLPPARQLN